ncbi:hypothetical protein DL98DRAFT_588920 [Cadophora sp. DSE1049]|nr:hypothetical protein DL98DRAFT_588920 [Cadophora sp. DSE1049]
MNQLAALLSVSSWVILKIAEPGARWDLASDRDPCQNFFEHQVIQVDVVQELRFVLPTDVAAPNGPFPEGQFRYTFYISSPERHHYLNFITQQKYHDYLERYPDVLELRGDPRTRPVRFKSQYDSIFMDIASLFALADFATPRGSPVGVGAVTGQGPPPFQRRQRLLNFNNIERLEWPLQDDLVDVFFSLSTARRPTRADPSTGMNSYESLTRNRFNAAFHFFRLPTGVVESGGGKSSRSGPGPAHDPEDDNPGYIPPPFQPGLPGQSKRRRGDECTAKRFGGSSSQTYSSKRRRSGQSSRRSYIQRGLDSVSGPSTRPMPSIDPQLPFKLMTLPYDLRENVWDFAAGRDPHDAMAPETIQVKFRSRLLFEGAKVSLVHRIVSFLLAYTIFLVRYPDVIHLPNTEKAGRPAQVIRFNAAIDTIFMDVPSLLALYDYSRPLWNSNLSGEGPARPRLQGFNLIQRLATPHVDNAIRGID